VLDYLLHTGSENVVLYFRDNIYIIKTLKEFQYLDEDGKDCGANVRQKAKDISNLLSDPVRLQEERQSRASMRDRMIKGSGGGYGEDDEDVGEGMSHAPPSGASLRRNRGADPDEDELRKAIEASKKSLAEEQSRKAEENDLATAIRLSEEEEAKRNKAVEDSNAAALFDDQAQMSVSSYLILTELMALCYRSSPNGSNNNNPFPFIDPTPYAAGLQPQYTVQPQYTMQPQFTSFNPYQQQAQQEAMQVRQGPNMLPVNATFNQQAEYLRQQQEWLHQQQEAQAQQFAQQAAQEDWLRQQQFQAQQQQQQFQAQQQQQQQQQQSLFAQPTGFGYIWLFYACFYLLISSLPCCSSNNPFAPATSPIPASSGTPVNGISGPSFNLPGTYTNSTAPSYNSSPAPSQAPASTPSPSINASTMSGASRPTRADQEHAHLANLFANRDDGQDTFGNVGALRFGQTPAGQLAAQKTGFGAQNNPFHSAQQQHGQSAEQPFFSI